MTSKAEVVVAAAIVAQDVRVLLVQRRATEGALSWQFPAGKIEPGETPEEAAVRETQEETGLRVAHKGHWGAQSAPDDGPGDSLHRMSARRGQAAVASAGEVADTVWATLDEKAHLVYR
ncbi:NUDIX hydrolase [Streptomyces sp. NBC_01420]|uniref:NUDIX hydrolase n=1 Tax=Streptomyces sp. NBC_01420 TaxID=2903858 RepID=UPI00386CBD88